MNQNSVVPTRFSISYSIKQVGNNGSKSKKQACRYRVDSNQRLTFLIKINQVCLDSVHSLHPHLLCVDVYVPAAIRRKQKRDGVLGETASREGNS